MSKTFESEFSALLEKYLGPEKRLTDDPKIAKVISIVNKIIIAKTTPNREETK